MSGMRPNSTQVPDVILDDWMPFLSGSELAVVMMVARKTFGWRKDADRIGISQMMAGTGLSRRTIQVACDSLAAAGVLAVRPSGDGVTASEYELNVDDGASVTDTLRARSVGVGGAKIAPVGGAKIAPTTDTIQHTPLPPKGGKAGGSRSSREKPADSAESEYAEGPAEVLAVQSKDLGRGKPGRACDHDPAGFTAFWEVYPRRVARLAAVRAWNVLRPEPVLQAELCAAVGRLALAESWVRDGGRFIPHPATFLNGRRWEDAPPAPPTVPPPAAASDALPAYAFATDPGFVRNFGLDHALRLDAKLDANLGAKQPPPGGGCPERMTP